MAATWLADALRAGGCRVDEGIVPDWKRRGHTDGGFSPIGVLGHHTAGPAGGDYPSLGTVRDGRPGLPGPLANLGLTRSGVWFPVAAGRAWHAGAGSCRWVPGNDGNGHLIGIEAESSGRGDWTPAQLEAYPRGVAALLRDLGVGADRFIAHKEWAPGRKTDPAGWPGDMNGFRATVARILNGDNDDMTPAQSQTLNDILAEVMAARRQDLLQLGAKIDGYGARVERIDEGAHGGWGYGSAHRGHRGIRGGLRAAGGEHRVRRGRPAGRDRHAGHLGCDQPDRRADRVGGGQGAAGEHRQG
jgi:hypothetical protein